jgi:hypothetical protein
MFGGGGGDHASRNNIFTILVDPEEIQEILVEEVKNMRLEIEIPQNPKRSQTMISPGKEILTIHSLGPRTKSRIPVMLEEDSQGESKYESGTDSGKIVLAKKVGIKSNHHKQEEKMDKEKELGLRKTMDGTLKKDSKGNRGPRGYVPPKGGLTKSTGK